MVIRRLPVIFLYLIRAHEAAIPSISDLDASASEKKIKEPMLPIHSLSSNLSQLTLESGGMNNTESLLPFFEISDRMNSLIGTISALDTKAAVEMIETELVQILDSDITLHDIAPTIGSLPIEAEELVLAAIENKAYTLLKLLQKVYIWRDEHQYHWFMALGYNSPWYDGDMKNDLEVFPLDWRNNLRAVCEADNGSLMTAIRNKIPSKDALKGFDKELLPLCAEYDAIKVFESAKFDPACLKEYDTVMASNSSAKLLQLYQIHTGIVHLHLEEYPRPAKLPANIDGFEFFISNGYNFLPMDGFIRLLCIEGRLDLLKYLQRLNPMLIPNLWDLMHAAEKNFKHILDWGRQFEISHDFSSCSVFRVLLENRYFDTLYWWIEVNKAPIYQSTIVMIAEFGALKVLQWVDKKYPEKRNFQKATNTAARNQHLPILKWIYKKYKVLPSVDCLEDVSGDMLDWIRSKGCTLKSPQLAMRLHDVDITYEYLVMTGVGNLGLLQWVFKNAPSSVFNEYKERIAMKIVTKEMMLWLYEKLEICPSRMYWAYETGDLEAIKWAIANCSIHPTERDSTIAAEKGHLHIIKWVHEIVYPTNPSCLSIATLQTAISFGKLEIAEYLKFHVFLEEKISVFIGYNILADKHLTILEWARKNKFDICKPHQQLSIAVRNNDVEALEWISANLSFSEFDPEGWWSLLIDHDRYNSYRWILERYPGVRRTDELTDDAVKAFQNGSFGMLRMFHEKYPFLLRSLAVSKKDMTRKNYHISQWLIANGYSLE